MIDIKNKNMLLNKLALGFEFVSLILSPVVIFILGGLYLQEKFNLSDGFLTFCVITSFVFMIGNIIMFIYKIIKIYTPSSKEGDNNENKRNT